MAFNVWRTIYPSREALAPAANQFRPSRGIADVYDALAETLDPGTQFDPAAGRILIVIAIGGLVEVIPLFYLKSTIETADGMRPYTPLELAAAIGTGVNPTAADHVVIGTPMTGRRIA